MPIHQTMPDHFYYQFFALTLISGLLLERIWHLMLILSSKHVYSPHMTQIKRYLLVALGFVCSAGPVGFMFVHWGVHDTFLGLNQLFDVSHTFGGAAWALFGIDMIGIPAMLGFALWFYFHPLEDDRYLAGRLMKYGAQ